MAVSLKKQTPIMREITPVHLIDEEDSLKIYRPNVSTVSFNNAQRVMSPPIDCIVTEVADTEVTEQSSFPSYSQLVQDGRQEHLAKVFQRPTEQEWSAFEKIKEQLIPIIKKSHKCETSCMVAVGIALLSVSVAIAMLVLSQWLFMCIGFGLFVLSFIAMYIPTRISPYDIDALDSCGQPQYLAETICGVESMQNLLVCSSGVDTRATGRKLKYRQNIDYVIFRPLHCTDDKAFKTIIKDEHNVFMIYDKTYEQVICVDPLLFE